MFYVTIRFNCKERKNPYVSHTGPERSGWGSDWQNHEGFQELMYDSRPDGCIEGADAIVTANSNGIDFKYHYTEHCKEYEYSEEFEKVFKVFNKMLNRAHEKGHHHLQKMTANMQVVNACNDKRGKAAIMNEIDNW